MAIERRNMARHRHHRKRRGSRAPLVAFAIILLLLAGVAIVGMFVFRREEEGGRQASAVEAPDYDNEDKWSEGLVSYNGESYRYNKNIRTYLFLGIDTDEPVHKAVDGISGGQSDALFLLVEDRDKDKLSIISINRNTMTNVSMYNREGEYIDDRVLQICLQHGYGDGERISCQHAADCVENLFFGIPIHGYMSLNMGGIGLLNDALGGVEVTVLQSLDNAARGVHLVEGETKVLNGDEAYVYVRSRDTSEFDSASDRLRRQEQYLNVMIPQMLRKIRGASSAVSIYNKAEDYLYSNIDFARLADEMKDMEYDSSEGVYTIPGETVKGERFEEYWPDEDGLYELILQIFYDKVDG